MAFLIKSPGGCLVSRICFLLRATRCVVAAIPRYHTVAKHSVSRRGGSPYLSEEFQFRTTANKDSRSNPRNLYPYNRLHPRRSISRKLLLLRLCALWNSHPLTYERFRYDVYFSTASAYLSAGRCYFARGSASNTVGADIIITLIRIAIIVIKIELHVRHVQQILHSFNKYLFASTFIFFRIYILLIFDFFSFNLLFIYYNKIKIFVLITWT